MEEIVSDITEGVGDTVRVAGKGEVGMPWPDEQTRERACGPRARARD